MMYECNYKFVRKWSNILLITMISAYYLWDIPILVLYIHKIRYIKKRRFQKTSSNTVTNDNNTKENKLVIVRRINYILTKITILTILYEIIGSFAFIAIKTLDINMIEQSILREFGILIDSVVMMTIVHFMMEYNDAEYMKLLKIISRLKLCCCFDLSGYDGTDEDKPKHNQQTNVPQKSNARNSIDTKTINALPVAPAGFKQQSIDSVI